MTTTYHVHFQLAVLIGNGTNIASAITNWVSKEPELYIVSQAKSVCVPNIFPTLGILPLWTVEAQQHPSYCEMQQRSEN